MRDGILAPLARENVRSFRLGCEEAAQTDDFSAFVRLCVPSTAEQHGVNSQSTVPYPEDTVEGFDLEKEQRRERLGWVFYGVGAMLLVVCGFYMQERVEQRVLHAYGLTVLCYGALLYVEEFEHLRRLWLWKGVLATIPLHTAFVASLFWWDANHPELAHSGFMFAYALWPVFVVEIVIFSLIIDHFKASASPDEPPRKLNRLLTWTKKPKPETGKVITMLDENGDDSDPTKEARKNYLKWSFLGISASLLATYLLRGVIISGTRLYILKTSLLTMLCYGHLLYVEQKDELRSKWLWATLLVTLPFHVALIGIIIAIDRAAPYLASNPIVFLFIIWVVAWVETRLMDQIADDYKPWGETSESVQ
jgi:hypothetical protein